MINLYELLPKYLLDSHNEKLSILCMCTAELKYLIFTNDEQTPQYVVQIGPGSDLAMTFEFTRRLSNILPDRVPEPLDLSIRDDGCSVFVQRGLAGRPWFTLQQHIKTPDDWRSIKDLSLNALHDFHSASESQPDWNQRIDLSVVFDTVRKRCEQIVGVPDTGNQTVLNVQCARLRNVGLINCFPQHGDFCINNLMFRPDHASIIDFEHFGHILQPLHDEFLLAGSLLALHPARNNQIDESLWQELIELSVYREQLEKDEIEALFVLYLMWWITETDDQKQRAPMALRYRKAFIKTLKSIEAGLPWTPEQAII